MNLDDQGLIERADPHRAREVLAAFPEQCRRALTLVAAPALSMRRPGLAVLAGMGGSAAGADLLAACGTERLDVPLVVHRGYGLPASVGRRALVVASSYSGDTEEVLSAVEAALERRVPVVALTAGGRLGELATRHRLPWVKLPDGLMPRMALGYLFLAGYRVLRDAGLEVASDAEVGEAVEVVTALADELAPARPSVGNVAKQLALTVGARIPVIYGGPTTGGVAYRWKTDIEENAKRLATAGAVPEMNHNEVEVWRAPAAKGLHAIMLRDRAEPSEIVRRFAVLHELITAGGGDTSECWTRGAGRPAKLLGLAYLGAWTSYYLAVGSGTDPWRVDLLDELKRRLRTA